MALQLLVPPLSRGAPRIGTVEATPHRHVASTVHPEILLERLDQTICVGADGLSIDLQPGLRPTHVGQVPEA